MSTYHICISIKGALAMHPKDFTRSYRGVFLDDDGQPIPPAKIKQFMKSELLKGHEIIPSSGCDNFDWKHGCRGHSAPAEGDGK